MKKIILGLMIVGSLYGAEIVDSLYGTKWYLVNMHSSDDYKNWFCEKIPEVSLSVIRSAIRKEGADVGELNSPYLGVFEIQVPGMKSIMVAKSKQACQKYLKGLNKHMKKASEKR